MGVVRRLGFSQRGAATRVREREVKNGGGGKLGLKIRKMGGEKETRRHLPPLNIKKKNPQNTPRFDSAYSFGYPKSWAEPSCPKTGWSSQFRADLGRLGRFQPKTV